MGKKRRKRRKKMKINERKKERTIKIKTKKQQKRKRADSHLPPVALRVGGCFVSCTRGSVESTASVTCDMHKPSHQQKGGTKFSEWLDSLELKQENESHTLFLIQKKDTICHLYSLPVSRSKWMAMNDCTWCFLPCLCERCPSPARRGSSLSEFLAFHLSGSVSLLGGKSILYCRITHANSKAGQWNQGGFPRFSELLGEVECVWLLGEQCYMMCEGGSSSCAVSIPSFPPCAAALIPACAPGKGRVSHWTLFAALHTVWKLKEINAEELLTAFIPVWTVSRHPPVHHLWL